MPGPSSPDGVAGRVSSAPSCRAFSVIAATVAASPPIARASACAVSLPELSSRPVSSCRTVYVPPGPIPARLPSIERSSGAPATCASGSSRSIATIAVSTLSVDAGR